MPRRHPLTLSAKSPVAILSIATIGIFAMARLAIQPPVPCPPITAHTANGTTLYLEVANTTTARETGLSHRSSLAPQHGMLFLFRQPDIYPFWMKDTNIPLDIIWLNRGKIVDAATLPATTPGAQIPIHTPSVVADTVIEVNADEALIDGLTAGQTVTYDLPATCQAQ